MLIRVALILAVVFVAWMILGAIVAQLRTLLPKLRRPALPHRGGGHEWEPKTRQLYRAWKQVPAPDEDREGIVAWVSSHRGVEAYVEPKTVMSPLSVAFVDDEGEWKRFQLTDDAFLRALAAERGLPVFDASRVGYPRRMRRRRSPPAG